MDTIGAEHQALQATAGPGGRRAPLRAGGRGAAGPRRYYLQGSRLLLLLVLLGLWAVIPVIWHTDLFTSRPSAVWAAVVRWQDQGLLWPSVWVTLHETLEGFVGGCLAGAVLGVLLGRIRLLGDTCHPFIVAVYSIPKIALAPVFILWFGIGLRPKTVLAASLVFFLVFFTTYDGMRKLDGRLEDLSLVMGASRLDVLRKVVLPQALTWVFIGAKLGLPYALLGAVAGELISSTQGLGFLIQQSTQAFDSAGTYAGILVLIVLAVAMTGILQVVESRVLAWHLTKPRE